MHSDDVGLRATFSWVATGLVLLDVGVTAAALVAHPGAYRAGFAPVVLVLLAVPVGVAAWRLAQGYGARRQFQAMVGVAVVALALHPWAWVDRSAYPPLLHVLGAVACVTAVASVRWSLVVVPGFAAGAAVLRAAQIGPAQAAGEAALSSLAGMVGTACVVVFARAARSVHASVEQSWQVAEDRARLEERAASRERWDGLVHDTVLAALSLASRSVDGGVPAAAEDLAREALGSLSEHAPAPGTAAERWRAHAERLGLLSHVEVTGDVADPEVREAIVRAGNEALVNVARHAGTRDVSVVGHLSADGASVVVRDEGRGFAPAEGLGIGLRTSVVARMRGVGGAAQVTSAPGRGTSVRLEWRAVTARAGGAETWWELGSSVPMIALAWGLTLGVVAVSAAAWGSGRSPVVSWLLVAVVLGLLGGVVRLAPTRRHGTVLAVGVLAVCAGGVLNTPVGAPVDWRYWFLSAVNPAVAAFAYRFRAGAGAVLVVAAVALVAVLDLLAGRPVWAVLTQPVPTLVATVAAAHMIRRALADAWETVEEASRQGAELRVALAAESERSQEAQARAAGLERVAGAALSRLAAGTSLTPAERAELALLAAAVRDQLAAPSLVDEAMLMCLSDARRRGVVVDVVAVDAASTGSSGTAAPDDVSGCRRVLAAVLASARPGSRVRVVWSPRGPRDGTVTVVGPSVPLVADAVLAAIETSGSDATISVDDDALLVRMGRNG